MSALLENFTEDRTATHEKNLAEIDAILAADDEKRLKRLRKLAAEEGLDAEDLKRRQTLLRRIIALEPKAAVPAGLQAECAAAFVAANDYFDATELVLRERELEHARLVGHAASLKVQLDLKGQVAMQLANAKRELRALAVSEPLAVSGPPAVFGPPAPIFVENERMQLHPERESVDTGHSIPQTGFYVPGTSFFYCLATSPEHAAELHAESLARSGRAPALPASVAQQSEPIPGEE
jgi:hypothetical protein